ncbi:MAG TPA: NapC/NirT family cytochrome c [Candidatus Nanopelagicales bacterium]|nr:NapC/NirT family cytochrome c [Candidatus Nanopelagicales bacterium]
MDAPSKVRFRRTRALINKIPLPTTRKGAFLGFLVIAGLGSILTVAAVFAVSFSETAAFCGLCHTMAPEHKAYEMSPHSELACAECHVEPGALGWVKAKAAGTKQLFQLVTNTYERPIPAPDHADLPAVQDTCMRCHSLESITANGGPVKLVLRPSYEDDEKNTRDLVAIVLRPAGLTSDVTTTASSDAENGPRGVHWHVQQDVEFTSADPRSQTIDTVTVNNPDGTTTQYIAANKVSVSSNVGPDIAKLQADTRTRRMDCIDCHNRIGHTAPNTSRAVDEAMSSGRISPVLPYIKKYAVDLLNADYATLEDAGVGMETLRETYATSYPAVATKYSAQIEAAIAELKTIYAGVATPDMKVQAQTYPDNLGHKGGPGCFRCHDGAHYKVVDGKVSKDTIPSTCSTCHTFPQIGGTVTGLVLAGAPTTHNDKMWVFSHKSAAAAVAAARNAALKHEPAGSVDPSGTNCGTCHQRSYCENCHTTGAFKIDHDQMLYNHAESIRLTGGKACAYCHQPVFCASCHQGNVLDTPAAKPTNGTVTS